MPGAVGFGKACELCEEEMAAESVRLPGLRSRLHEEIAYIAYGELLAHGTVEEVIESSHLTTYIVSAHEGEGINALAEELNDMPGIDMVAPFGTSLHVSGRDAERLETAIAPYRKRKEFEWQRSEPSLEDVFIDLMGKATDNFQ